jgi:signal transduction histidine kinase
MKLLTYTSRYFLALMFALLAILCTILYFSIQTTIYGELDEYLFYRQQEIVRVVRQHPHLIHEKPLYTRDFNFKEITKEKHDRFLSKHNIGEFEDALIEKEWDGEKEPFRRLESVFSSEGKYYKLTVFSSSFRSEELLLTLFFHILVLFLLLGLLIVLLNRFLLKRIWTPFHLNLEKIKSYRLDHSQGLVLQTSRISEFRELNQSVEELVQNSWRIYQSQKQFIENASHEMQTPLAIIRNKIDLFIEAAPLNEEQAEFIRIMMEQVDRLSRLNKTLLLLSKIENNQFDQSESLEMGPVISDYCDAMMELIDHKHLYVTFHFEQPCHVRMNKDLAAILISNLLQNAIQHNWEGGHIHIVVKKASLSISNSGKELGIKQSSLFERFSKNPENPGSNGLGLALVKTICQFYHFNIEYSYRESEHIFSVRFHQENLTFPD